MDTSPILVRAERWMAGLAGTALVLLMLIVLVDVLGRNLLNRPLAAGTELTELLMALMVFLAFPLLAWRQRDITVDLFDFLAGSAALARVQTALAGVVGAVVYGLLSYEATVFARRAMTNGDVTPQLQFPLSAAWWTIMVLAGVAALASLVVAACAFGRHPIRPGGSAEAGDEGLPQ